MKNLSGHWFLMYALGDVNKWKKLVGCKAYQTNGNTSKIDKIKNLPESENITLTLVMMDGKKITLSINTGKVPCINTIFKKIEISEDFFDLIDKYYQDSYEDIVKKIKYEVGSKNNSDEQLEFLHWFLRKLNSKHPNGQKKPKPLSPAVRVLKERERKKVENKRKKKNK